MSGIKVEHERVHLYMLYAVGAILLLLHERRELELNAHRRRYAGGDGTQFVRANTQKKHADIQKKKHERYDDFKRPSQQNKGPHLAPDKAQVTRKLPAGVNPGSVVYGCLLPATSTQ